MLSSMDFEHFSVGKSISMSNQLLFFQTCVLESRNTFSAVKMELLCYLLIHQNNRHSHLSQVSNSCETKVVI